MNLQRSSSPVAKWNEEMRLINHWQKNLYSCKMVMKNRWNWYQKRVILIDTHLGIYCSPGCGVPRNDNLLPFRRNDLQGHMQQDCNLNTHSPTHEVNNLRIYQGTKSHSSQKLHMIDTRLEKTNDRKKGNITFFIKKTHTLITQVLS